MVVSCNLSSLHFYDPIVGEFGIAFPLCDIGVNHSVVSLAPLNLLLPYFYPRLSVVLNEAATRSRERLRQTVQLAFVRNTILN